MKDLTIYFVQLAGPARATAEEAARDLWPHARFVSVQTVSEAARLAPAAAELLVLGQPDEVEAAIAAQTLDAGELPRWATVCLDGGAADIAETIAPADWNVPLLTRVFRSAVLQQELLRENLRLRGDLKTIARRITHDARTPLGCIRMVCELLRDAPAGTADGLRDNIDVILTSTAEVSALVDRVSSLIRASLEPVPASVFGMSTVVEHVLQQLQPEIEASGRKIRQPAQWPEAEGVPAWVEVIWWNLVRNAITHGSADGHVQLGWKREDGALRFWVSSQGAVPPSDHVCLHRPFHLLHQQSSAGLGLSFVERFVSLQGGRCGYEPDDNDRAVFYFTLPPPAVEAKVPVRAPARAARR
jgi:signal transduction histidine kinase